MSLSVINKIAFIDSFQFLSSSLDSLVKYLGKDNFKYLSQKFDNNILDLYDSKGIRTHNHLVCKLSELSG